MHQAVLENSIELIRLLLENNANVNSFDEDSWTPLHAAASLGFYDVTKYMQTHSNIYIDFESFWS